MGTRLQAQESGRRGAFFRALHSIRTRYSLLTAAFLLLILGAFYIGGRIVLIHLVRDAEDQVKGIGVDIRTLAYRNADKIRAAAAEKVPAYGAASREGKAPAIESLLGGSPCVTLAARFRADGSFAEGAVLVPEGSEALSATDFSSSSFDCTTHMNQWVLRFA